MIKKKLTYFILYLICFGAFVGFITDSEVASQSVGVLMSSIAGYYIVSLIISYFLKKKEARELLVVALLIRFAISVLASTVSVDGVLIDLAAFAYWYFYDQITGLHLEFKNIKLF